MNPYRKALAKHYCPVCDSRLRRLREPWGEDMLRTLLVYPVVAFAGLVIGGAISKLGWIEGRGAYVLGLVFVALVAFPLADRFSRYHCDQCEAERPYGEAVSRGWLFAL
jgi:hypothetical protein